MATPSLPETLRGLASIAIHQELALSADQLELLGRTIQEVISSHASRNQNQQLHWIAAWQYGLKTLRLPHNKTIAETLNEVHIRAMHRKSKLFPYTMTLLNLLRRKAIPVCLVSNVTGPPDVFDDLLREQRIFEFFDARIWSSQVMFRKPRGIIFRRALRYLAMPASRAVLMVGDDEAQDIQGANALGLTTICLVHSNGVAPTTEASYVVSDDNILAFFERLGT